MAGQHGGRRPGSGRKKGTRNARQTAKLVKDLVERGESPLQYFLSIMMDKNEPTQRRDWAADAAAPYCHARLASVDQTTTFKGNPLADILNAIDGRTTGINSGTEPPEGSPLAPEQPLQRH